MTNTSHLFWNHAPKRSGLRSVDPLGFDALREAMADSLVPLLTGATRKADEYVWTLLGLRWAREETGSAIDDVIFNRGFAIFERALKQYWYQKYSRPGAGINIVKELCGGDKPNVRRAILVDQRATGLLGSYVVSLRGMGLVKRDCVLLDEDNTDRLLNGTTFTPPRSWLSSWRALRDAFSAVAIRCPIRRLGVRLFDESDPAMRRAACATLAARRRGAWPSSWQSVCRSQLDNEQARLCMATQPVARLEVAVLDSFAQFLRGNCKPTASSKRELRHLAAKAQDSEPFPSSWDSANPLRKAIACALSSLARGRDPVETLIQLHLEVTQNVRKNEPWIRLSGDVVPGFDRWAPGTEEPDYRFQNLCRLLRETHWRPNAH